MLGLQIFLLHSYSVVPVVAVGLVFESVAVAAVAVVPAAADVVVVVAVVAAAGPIVVAFVPQPHWYSNHRYRCILSAWQTEDGLAAPLTSGH